MNTEKRQNGVANFFILLSVLGRLIPHPANATPVGAISLVGGAKLNRFWKWTIPFVALVLSDFLLGVFFKIQPWSFTTLFVYTSFAINIFLGSQIKNSNRYFKLGAFSIIGGLQFFLITNFGVWLEGVLYAKTFTGLMQCYAVGLPYLRNTLVGDLCWSFGLFFIIDKAQVWIHKPTLKQATSL